MTDPVSAEGDDAASTVVSRVRPPAAAPAAPPVDPPRLAAGPEGDDAAAGAPTAELALTQAMPADRPPLTRRALAGRPEMPPGAATTDAADAGTGIIPRRAVVPVAGAVQHDVERPAAPVVATRTPPAPRPGGGDRATAADASAGLRPGIHARAQARRRLWGIALICAGIVLICGAGLVLLLSMR